MNNKIKDIFNPIPDYYMERLLLSWKYLLSDKGYTYYLDNTNYANSTNDSDYKLNFEGKASIFFDELFLLLNTYPKTKTKELDIFCEHRQELLQSNVNLVFTPMNINRQLYIDDILISDPNYTMSKKNLFYDRLVNNILTKGKTKVTIKTPSYHLDMKEMENIGYCNQNKYLRKISLARLIDIKSNYWNSHIDPYLWMSTEKIIEDVNGIFENFIKDHDINKNEDIFLQKMKLELLFYKEWKKLRKQEFLYKGITKPFDEVISSLEDDIEMQKARIPQLKEEIKTMKVNNE